jgi:hypothetical protein
MRMSGGEKPARPDPFNRLDRRHWLRFSIRSLLAATALTALPFSWLRRRMVAARHQSEAVSHLTSLGGSSGYNHEWDDEKDRYSGNPPPGPALLRALLGEHFFLTPALILFSEFNGDPSDLAPIAQLQTVRHLGITDSDVDDRVVPFLTPLSSLEYLSLYGTHITDNGLQQLSSLSYLRSIVVTKTKVTKSGLARFKLLRPRCDIYSMDD